MALGDLIPFLHKHFHALARAFGNHFDSALGEHAAGGFKVIRDAALLGAFRFGRKRLSQLLSECSEFGQC